MTDRRDIIFSCPKCGGAIKLPAGVSGRGNCPHCGHKLQIHIGSEAVAREPEVPKTATGKPRTGVARFAPDARVGSASRRSSAGKPARRPAFSLAHVWVGAGAAVAVFFWAAWLVVHLAGNRPGRSEEKRELPGILSGARVVSVEASPARGREDAPSPLEPSERPVASEITVHQVTAFQWGTSADDHGEDIAVRPDGRVVVIGMLGAEQVPAGTHLRRVWDTDETGPRPFVAEWSATGDRLNWVTVFGAGTWEPRRLVIARDGSLYLGGKAGPRMATVAGPGAGDFGKSSAAIIKLAEDGSRVEWARAGGPNQEAVTGLAVDAQGRVLWTAGTRGRGEAAYVMRLNADGSPSSFPARPQGRTWAIDLHHTAEDLRQDGQYWGFYLKSQQQPEGFDYDGPGGWNPVHFTVHGIREGGQVLVLPDGDLVVSGTMQYEFRIQGQRTEPGFDLFLARYTVEGRLVWSTNLYQPGDSVHTPDQKAVDLAYSAATGMIYVLARQHGSNVYRLKGELVGDTGNLMISWVGCVEAATGVLRSGYYFHNSRNSGYDDRGIARPPPHPKLAGNELRRVAVDRAGRVHVVGNAAAKAWTTPGAWRTWPAEQEGGSNGAWYVLSAALDRPLYATMIRGSEGNRSGMSAIAILNETVWVVGSNSGPDFATSDRPAWTGAQSVGGRDVAAVRFTVR